MKKTIRSIFTLTLCIILVITGIINTGTDTACAADGKMPVKVTFKKKTVTIDSAPKQFALQKNTRKSHISHIFSIKQPFS